MAEHSTIEWTDATWNVITGCSVLSKGCTNCYAMRLAGTRLQHHPSRAGLTRDSAAGPVWTGEVRFNEEWLDQPSRWRKPRRIFVCAHGDLFHESVPDAWIDRVFIAMQGAQHHTFQVLTKRAERMRRYLQRFQPSPPRDGYISRDGVESNRSPAGWPLFHPARWPLPNVWLGVSVEDQTSAESRIPELLATPAAVRWCSAEPLLGPIDLASIEVSRQAQPNEFRQVNATIELNALAGTRITDLGFEHAGGQRLDWVVAGGESGPDARPAHPEWFRTLRDQCAATHTAFHFKQWGSWTPGENVERTTGTVNTAFLVDDRWHMHFLNLATDHGHIDDQPDLYHVGKKAAGRHLDGRTHDDWPEVHP